MATFLGIKPVQPRPRRRSKLALLPCLALTACAFASPIYVQHAPEGLRPAKGDTVFVAYETVDREARNESLAERTTLRAAQYWLASKKVRSAQDAESADVLLVLRPEYADVIVTHGQSAERLMTDTFFGLQGSVMTMGSQSTKRQEYLRSLLFLKRSRQQPLLIYDALVRLSGAGLHDNAAIRAATDMLFDWSPLSWDYPETQHSALPSTLRERDQGWLNCWPSVPFRLGRSGEGHIIYAADFAASAEVEHPRIGDRVLLIDGCDPALALGRPFKEDALVLITLERAGKILTFPEAVKMRCLY